jgi:hypothetical protein
MPACAAAAQGCRALARKTARRLGAPPELIDGYLAGLKDGKIKPFTLQAGLKADSVPLARLDNSGILQWFTPAP